MAIEACGKSEREREKEKASSMGENIGKCFKGRGGGKGRFSCHGVGGVGNAANERNGVRSRFVPLLPALRGMGEAGSVQPLPNENEAQVGNSSKSISE